MITIEQMEVFDTALKVLQENREFLEWQPTNCTPRNSSPTAWWANTCPHESKD